jgi:hypothetical protein
MCRLDAVAVGKHDEVGAWAVHAEEMGGAAGVRDGRVFVGGELQN